MERTWDDALLRRASELPPELIDAIEHASNRQYLEAIMKASLDGRCTYILFAHCEPTFAHVCSTLRDHSSLAATVATLGRIVPFAPYLTPYAERALHEIYNLGTSHDEDLLYLLGLFRLLRHDHRTFIKYVHTEEIGKLLQNSHRAMVYLAIRIFHIYLEGADAWFETMIKRWLGPDTAEGHINGQWDDRVIDYRFLTLWEEQRYEQVEKLLQDARQQLADHPAETRRVLPEACFHPSTALIGGLLLPREQALRESILQDSLAHAPTVDNNLRAIASALKSPRPILLAGAAGSGKTLLIRHVAQRLGKLNKMVTLHLNEQSDAKLLVGIRTTGETPGSFIWKAGVLTTAVQEGRWVLIEDLDRAPNDVISMLLPLIEKRQLYVSNRKQRIHAQEGFRIIATVRTNSNHRGQDLKVLGAMVGRRHWQDVTIAMPPINEQRQIALQLFPSLSQLLPQFIAVFERLQVQRQQAVLVGQSRNGILRPISPRDLLKWCSRLERLLQNRTTFTSSDLDDVFMEATDCFVGALPDCPPRTAMAATIAEELRIDPQRRDYLLGERDVRYEVDKTKIVIGRYSLLRAQLSKPAPPSSFSTNPHTSRMLERVAAAAINREPLLLVGETGVGKTTAVQHLAGHLGKKLVPFNLSQQSEAGDLLGGFKPVNTRSLIIPIKDEFDALFSASFSYSKNQQFLELLGKQMAKSNWKAVCRLWRQALKMVDQLRAPSSAQKGEAPSKKRKVEMTMAPDRARWDAFATKVTNMERQLAAGGSESFAFSFVEGNIVKAVRNGDWVLLDEINLSSPDTLEAIVDLFNPSAPSLLLTEAGNIERIEAHPDFRVFAAMNPATDVGKKDLQPGIRSRFTELYVESPDKDIKSLQSIVRAYLRHEAASDQAVALDVSTLYQRILGLAEQNKLVDGAGQKPHFSLRTLTRTLSYAKYIAPMCSLRRALHEGFQMSFLTFLDAESAKLVQPLLEQYLFGKRTNVRAELKKALRKPNDGHSYVQGYPGSKHWVRQGSLELEDRSQYIITPFIRNNLENLVRASSTLQFPVLIQGPTSSGKTSMIEYLAKRTGHRFVRINNHEHTDLQEYLGTYVSGTDGRLQFQEGILVKALREGHWIVLDELNLAPTDVLEALNRLLDDNRELLVPETQEVVRPHESFMLFATQNPAGLYGGRKTLSRAFRNRFLELHFDDIPVDELQEILHKRTQLPESRCKRIVSVYRELSVLRQENRLFEQKSFATLRDLFRWALRPNDTIEQLAANGFMLLAERVRKPEERDALRGIIEKIMSASGPRVTIDESALYSPSCSEIELYNRNAAHHDVVWTKAMRRLYILVSRAIANDEPVLLVGETGCGKTTVCQMLADAFGQDLHTVNAHQNTETGDLIGSQRPIRNRAVVEAQLRQQILASPLLHELETGAAHPTEALLDAYDHALASLAGAEKQRYTVTDDHTTIQASRTRFKALFEWVDGSLVQAMKSGAFFLLDEISLADDSVLERINSVLEPQRSILLAEKGSLESFVTAAPGFQVFATMNPGGDYGKRELSPALRNRFTEIWVPSLSDTDDIVQIVRAKLPEPAQGYASALVSFAQWFNDKYNTSANSSISIRDALAWVEFVKRSSHLGLITAVVHGAAMVYIDTLGANPAGLMSLTGSSLDEERRECLDRLGQLMGADASAIYHHPVELAFTAQAFAVGSFTLPVRSGGRAPFSSFSFEAPTTRANAMRVMRAMQLPKPVMLEGSPGVGKTALVTAIAEATNVPLTRINLSEQTDLMDLFGSDVPVEGAETGTFEWRDAPFLQAMKRGEWVLLDEMNLASQSVLEGLNACLDHRGEVFVPEIGQTFIRHPEFKLFAAQNPHHQGGGRKGLPASFVNRFTVVYADAFRPEDLMLVCQRTFPQVDAATIERAVCFVNKLDEDVSQRKRLATQGAPWEFNLRDISRWMGLVSSEQGLLQAGNARDFIDILFTRRFRTSSDRAYIHELLSSLYTDTPTASDLFSSTSPHCLQIGLGLLPRHSTFAPISGATECCYRDTDSLRTLQSLLICVQQNWPVILGGPSGSGKSCLIEGLARTVGASVETFALNADTDAMDLVGGYEQSDAYSMALRIFQDIRIQLSEAAKAGITTKNTSKAFKLLDQIASEGLGSLLENGTLAYWIDELQSQLPGQAAQLQQLSKKLAASTEKARFEWVDGILVDALQQGRWLVLDNANLCSPSVLDRLNSLLEPNGSLIINERTAEDGSPRVIRPHPDFRIFLTLDPRYGELSRAMRNRAVELYLTTRSRVEVAPAFDPLQFESAVARFGQVKALGNVQAAFRDSRDLRSVAADHLAVSDEHLVPRFDKQLRAGLYAQMSEQTPRQLVLNDSFAEAARMKDETLQLYKLAVDQNQVPADSACVQTLHPLNNQPLIQQSLSAFQHATLLGFGQDLLHTLCNLETAFNTFHSNPPLVARLIRAERSLTKATKTDTIMNVVQFLLQVLGVLARGSRDLASSKLADTKRETMLLCGNLHMLDEFIFAETIDAAALGACFSNTKRSLRRLFDMVPSAALQELITAPKITLLHRPQRESECEAFWRALRPRVPTTNEQLADLQALESLTERFDQLCLQYHLTLSDVASLRLSFTRALGTARGASSDVRQLLEDVGTLLPDQSGQGITAPTSTRPHFVDIFACLRKHFALLDLPSDQMSDSVEDAKLDVLAEQPTKSALLAVRCAENHTEQLAVRVLARLGAIYGHTGVFTSSAISSFAGDLTDRFATVNQVPLRALSLLQSELGVLGKFTATKAHQLVAELVLPLDACLKSVLSAVLASLIGAGEETGLSVAALSLRKMLDQDSGRNGLEMASFNDMANLAARDASVVQLLRQTTLYLKGHVLDTHERYAQSSKAWRSIALASLQLYLPDGLFDPALGSIMERDGHRHSRSMLVNRLKAVQTFRRALTGDESSLRARLLEADINNLGPEPATVNIYRPLVSELPQLQTEFDGLRRIIVALSNQVSQPDGIASVDANTWLNIRHTRKRLTEHYSAYLDFTVPVVGFIDCLALSHDLEDEGSRLRQTHSNSLVFASITPLVEATLESWMSDSAFTQAFSVCQDQQDRLFALSALATRCAIKPISSTDGALRSSINQHFSSVYSQWVTELSHDQRQAAAKSSLYRYSGAAQTDDEMSSEDIGELFPSYEEQGSETGAPRLADQQRAQGLAPTIAMLHRAIFRPAECGQTEVLDLLSAAAQQIQGDASTSRVKSWLPLLLLRLHQVSSQSPGSTSKPAYNISTDANLEQVKKLLDILERVLSRFRVIQEAWPEHATPTEVIRTAESILQYSHADPLMKFLPNLEKLHATVTEWQKVASSEYSAQSVLDEITNLIISWRQLELSSWAGLFERETQRCSDQAASWWYVAFESIVAATEDLDVSDHGLQRHTCDLLSALQDFMVNSGLGEYSTRLDILRSFEAHLHSLATYNPSFATVRQGLGSFIAYFGNFQVPVNKALADGRKALEKEIRNVIQVASWKDRNIDTLRQSAKSSHKKLLRSVRKYRALLAQPVTPITQAGIPEQDPHRIARPGIQVPTIAVADQHSDSETELRTQSWTRRPERFRNVQTTVELMQMKVKSGEGTLSSYQRISSYMTGLGQAITELQKATPTVLSEKNKAGVTHLKNRKRRLLADVLKDIHTMGFRSNLSGDVLHIQATLPLVLAKMPDIACEKKHDSSKLAVAEYDLHRFLGIMFSVRECTRKHSDDLTPAEVARCLNYLESMLQNCLTQRVSLCSHLEQIHGLQNELTALNAFANVDSPDYSTEVTEAASLMSVQLKVLPSIVATSSELIQIQSTLAGKDYTIISQELKERADAIVALRSRADERSLLPAHISSSMDRALLEQTRHIVNTLEEQIQQWSINIPELEPTLCQILKWLNANSLTLGLSQQNGHMPMENDHWAQMLMSALDTMLGAVQAVEKVTQVPSLDRSEASWLLKQQKTIDSALSALHVKDLRQQLSALTSQLHTVGGQEAIHQLASTARVLRPILHAYATAADDFLDHYCRLHSETARMAYVLSKSFVELCSRGFCTPSEKEQDNQQQAGDVETGTGLGEGEGGEDISKDVAGEEDLSELAQESKGKEQAGDEIEDEKDAVDMADEELEGVMGEAEAASEDDGDNSRDEEHGDIEEEAGQVGDADPSAVDEKMWDEGKVEEQKDKEAESGKGSKKEEEMTAANEKNTNEQSNEGEGETDDDQTAETAAEEEVTQQDSERVNPQAQDEDNLDLPEDIDIDGKKPVDDDNSDLDMMDDDVDQANGPEEAALQDMDDNVSEVSGQQANGDGNEEEIDVARDAGDETEADQEAEQDKESGEDEGLLQAQRQEQMLDDMDVSVSGEEGTGYDQDAEQSRHNGVATTEHDQIDGDQTQEDQAAAGAAGAQGEVRSEEKNADGNTQAVQQQTLPYQQLGDVLEDWYRQHQNIEAAAQGQESEAAEQPDMDMTKARFEHLQDHAATADTQALGTGSADQAQALDEDRALPVNEDETHEDRPIDYSEEENEPADTRTGAQDHMHLEPSDSLQSDQRSKAFVGQQSKVDQDIEMADNLPAEGPDAVESVDNQLTNIHISHDEYPIQVTIEDARTLWSRHETNTRNLALVLTEHLRLILQPTQATKMRGDFRTGKRLNIKRIIPYIASSYKRDKIWMRRSVPSKRSYQVMLAIDDSRSMAEGESKDLAFDTLAMVAKSMSMLEVGELAVVGFGEDVTVAHEFNVPFTTEAGAHTFQHFTFAQSRTNVRKLLAESIEMFREARLKATSSASDLWQLQLIISDGICEDHAGIRQLIRQAHEERIMVVFIIVDAAAQSAQAQGDPKQSLLDLQTAEFVKDEAGEMQLKMVKYLDTFPFRYYLVVRDVHELPGVLAGALRQWFSEVVDTVK